jgi:Tfp pilus assembly protein PilF
MKLAISQKKSNGGYEIQISNRPVVLSAKNYSRIFKMSRPKLSFLLFVIVLLLRFAPAGMPVNAQDQRPDRDTGRMSGQITGQVRYKGGTPAFDVLVSCDAFSGGTVEQTRTDRSGRFRFDRLGASQFRVIVSVPGYITAQETVELMTTPSAYVQFELVPNPNDPAAKATSGVVAASIPQAAQQEFDQGEKALSSGNKEGLQQAVKHYEKAVQIHPRFVQAQLKLGTSYMDLGEWAQAEAALKKTLELDATAVNASFALGEVYLRQKKDEEAEKVVLQGLQTENRSYQGHLTLARVYWDMASQIKDETQARPLLEKAYEQVKKSLELNPNFAHAHLVKGNLLLRVRRVEDAQHEFEEYLRLEPKGPFAEQARTTVEKIKKALASQPPAKP